MRVDIGPPALLAVLLVTAGCVGVTDGGTTTTPPTDTTTDGALRESPVFEYGNLSEESQREFRLVLRRGTIETTEPLFAPRIADARYNRIRVRYDGSVVTIRHQIQSQAQRVCLREVTAVENATVGADSGVGNYSDLSAEGKALFRTVLNGTAVDACYGPSHYPLADYSHVRYRGNVYALSELQGSTTVYAYRVANGTGDGSGSGE